MTNTIFSIILSIISTILYSFIQFDGLKHSRKRMFNYAKLPYKLQFLYKSNTLFTDLLIWYRIIRSLQFITFLWFLSNIFIYLVWIISIYTNNLTFSPSWLIYIFHVLMLLLTIIPFIYLPFQIKQYKKFRLNINYISLSIALKDLPLAKIRILPSSWVSRGFKNKVINNINKIYFVLDKGGIISEKNIIWMLNRMLSLMSNTLITYMLFKHWRFSTYKQPEPLLINDWIYNIHSFIIHKPRIVSFGLVIEKNFKIIAPSDLLDAFSSFYSSIKVCYKSTTELPEYLNEI